jgi:cytochrome c-type biogenesis protein CcmE
MDPSRKRKARLVLALSVAVLLAGALVYTSFSASTEASTPSELRASAEPGRSYELTGKVVARSVDRAGDGLRFAVRDREGRSSLPVVYEGVVPDPFREGREVIVSGRVEGGTFVAERDSLVTKCPSKFTKEEQASTGS